ncbi:phage late control D family protein [Methylobacterium sp. J-076]|uniref:phage late control D family protein n=1 Tax=Methylobacterium sp. J-076 TaxID=2836655 RepID=UPI001FBA6AC7|nr:contractile injection system protein, VgrG/Pvc8 family [Methylobacterium sp. J-076]MCJ2012169.1 hypothetical protein [Methylobacterium sp. J-076]
MQPGYTPIYKIMKGGIDITDRFNDRTTEIQVDLKGGGGDSDTCKITVDDRDWKIATVEVGAKLEVYLGFKETWLAQMGIFQVGTVDYVIMPKQIEIVGNSVGFTGAIKAPAIKNFENKKLGDVLNEIGALKGASVYVDPEFRDIELPFVNQTSSPLHLLHELERRFGAVAKFENDRLVFAKRDEGESTEGSETPVIELRPWHISKGFVRHTDRSQFDGVKVGWFDKDHVKQYAEVEDPNASKEADGTTQQDFYLSKQLGRSEAEAKMMAKSQMAMLKRAQGEAHLTLAKGYPWIRDQMRTLLRGFRSEVNGSYVIDTVTHTFTKEPGIVTEILAKPPGTGEDYEGLDEGAFLRLGRQLPSLESVEAGKAPVVPEPIDKPDASGAASPVVVDTTPVNV